MAGFWLDLVVILAAVVSVLRGFHRGFVREVFGLIGALLAVMVAYEGYQSLSAQFLETYAMAIWQAQLLAFGILCLGISLLAALFGFVWSRIIELTPFALLDHLAGALFGGIKIVVILIAVVALVASLNAPPAHEVLEDSRAAQKALLVLPLMYQWLEAVWPQAWSRPGWLFRDYQRQTERLPGQSRNLLVFSSLWPSASADT